MKPRWRKGTALLQTLVMSVLLSMAAVMMMKWVLARYMMAARNYRSTVAKAHSHGYGMERFSTWNFNTSAVGSGGTIFLDTKKVEYNTSGDGDTMRTVVIESYPD